MDDKIPETEELDTEEDLLGEAESEDAPEDPGTDEQLERELAEAEASSDLPFGFRRAAEKVRSFPRKPGVYLMKDASARVIYVGKAKSLRSRAGSYFLKAARQEARTAHWVLEIGDIDYLECEAKSMRCWPRAD